MHKCIEYSHAELPVNDPQHVKKLLLSASNFGKQSFSSFNEVPLGLIILCATRNKNTTVNKNENKGERFVMRNDAANIVLFSIYDFYRVCLIFMWMAYLNIVPNISFNSSSFMDLEMGCTVSPCIVTGDFELLYKPV